MSKYKSAIEKIVVSEATFQDSPDREIVPTWINFFYGNNGSGKTTISRMIMFLPLELAKWNAPQTKAVWKTCHLLKIRMMLYGVNTETHDFRQRSLELFRELSNTIFYKQIYQPREKNMNTTIICPHYK